MDERVTVIVFVTISNFPESLVLKVRFARTMETAKFDQGLKEDRNLDYGDSEFYDYKEVIGSIYLVNCIL